MAQSWTAHDLGGAEAVSQLRKLPFPIGHACGLWSRASAAAMDAETGRSGNGRLGAGDCTGRVAV